MNEMYDVVVVGLGPAGSVLSKILAENGLKVLALERKVHPRVKPCAGCISQRIDQIFDLSALDVVEGSIYGATLSYLGKEPVTQYSTKTLAYMVRRERFDQKLMQEAESAGAEIVQNVPVKRVTRDNGLIEVHSAAGTVRAPMVAGADGSLSVVRRCLMPNNEWWQYATLERRIDNGDVALSIRDRVHIDLGWVTFGYGWIFPHANAVSAGLAVLLEKKRTLRKCFSAFLRTMGLESTASQSNEKTLAHPIVSFARSRPTVAVPGAILLGDAAGLTDPLTGEGIYFAVYSAQLAATAILDVFRGKPDALSQYERRMDEEFYSEFRQAAWATRWIYRFPKYFVHKVRRNPEIMDVFFRILRGEESYRRVSSELKRHFLRRIWFWRR
ncbi:MAG: NAD(P)/FAD-dependent oxidoreductase [Deltaproteobacteria bacterium]|nr:NAD(P)/FAD-dependent oxidoreductase [Deltaproteobacteria bacterium]